MTEPTEAQIKRALQITDAARDLLTAISDDIAPGAVTWQIAEFAWIDDGKDDIVIRVRTPGKNALLTIEAKR